MWKITVHCSDSDHLHHNDITVVHNWHISEPRNWRKGGYHFFIKFDGTIQDYESNPDEARRLHPFEQGAHTKNFNKNNIGICLAGKKNFTEAQFKSLRRLIQNLMFEFEVPREDVQGHNYYDSGKTCPNFDVTDKIFGHRRKLQTY